VEADRVPLRAQPLDPEDLTPDRHRSTFRVHPGPIGPKSVLKRRESPQPGTPA